MRHIIRRLILFPIILIGAAPVMFFVAWCLDGMDEAIKLVDFVLSDAWG